jgi:hypothetical protein
MKARLVAAGCLLAGLALVGVGHPVPVLVGIGRIVIAYAIHFHQ